jgi:hypothetical protein
MPCGGFRSPIVNGK